MSADGWQPRRTTFGPMLYLRGYQDDRLSVAVLVVKRAADPASELVTVQGRIPASQLLETCGNRVYRYVFDLPARSDAWYEFDGARIGVNAEFRGDLRVAYVSCNGMEHGDLARPSDERNALWRRLADQHAEAPFNLLLQGGDQVYADEVIEVHPASKGWPGSFPDCLSTAGAAELTSALREALFRRYLHVFDQPEFAWLTARVPSLAMWDDHDIYDGWGSYPEPVLESDVGRCIRSAAREGFLLFQLCAAPDEVPAFCPDAEGENLTWSVHLPGLDVVAPDLRSERHRRQVMGSAGWSAFRAAVARCRGSRMLLLSSVPAVGPRLSVVERVMQLTPWMEEYEDDLNDQWQSRHHREEWREFLRVAIGAHERDGTSVTYLSGEIHLATRGTISTATGDMHQLIASGIAHPAPSKAQARILGGLAHLGDSPLGGHEMRLRPLPGKRSIYTPERNYLLLTRVDGDWTAVWELEESGRTPPLAI